MIEALFFIILLNFLYGLFRFGSRINPVTILTAGFLVESTVCLLYKPEWGLESFQLKTLILVGGGITVYTGVCALVNCYSRPRSVVPLDNELWTIKTNYLWVFLVANVVIQYFVYKYTLAYSGGSDLGAALAEIDREAKFGESEFQLPIVLRNLWFLFNCLSYCMLLQLSRLLISKKTNKKFWLMLAFAIISFMGGFLSGSRNASISMIVFFIVCYTVLLTKKYGKKKLKISFRKIFICALTAFVAVFAFLKSTELIGRDLSAWGEGYYFAFYCGAEIKNIDTYVSETHPKTSFGYYTLPFLPKEKSNYQILRFRTNGAYMLGNVYTCFLNYYQDFGIWGSMLCMAFMAFIMQKLYMRSLASATINSKVVDMSIIMYAFMCRHLFMSFFAERFYGAFKWDTVKVIIELLLLSYVLYRYCCTRLQE